MFLHNADALAIAKQRQDDYESDARDRRVARVDSSKKEPESQRWTGAAARRRPAIV
ncbi:hypothetical protein Lesp02_49040 [Lentzea sp. NBRC 105346]|nr:hypothetical protein Lesp02_49040 [Lentzea sp. NBRC 105346]